MAAKPKLLVLELWGLGDQAFATPFLQAASAQYTVTLLGKAYGRDLRPRFWPAVDVLPFAAPWTVHRGKYRLHRWPWRELIRLTRQLRQERFAAAVSGRWDPRDHGLMFLAGAPKRVGIPRVGSRRFLTDPVAHPGPAAHRYDFWRVVGAALGVSLPPRDQWRSSVAVRGREIMVHTGAAQPVRVWPLERYAEVVRELRQGGYGVVVVCDADQRDWWLRHGESGVRTPANVSELLTLLERAAVFLGNDSGAGHVAAIMGVPTFTVFGPQVAEGFTPLHPRAEFIPGKPCAHKPCFDYCRFDQPHCLLGVETAEVWRRLREFVRREVPKGLVVRSD